MKKNRGNWVLLCVSAIWAQVACAAGVSVTEPANDATVSSPFALQAVSTTCDSQPVVTMAYSIGNGTDSAAVDGTSLHVEVTASIGESQVLHVKSWGNKGAGCDTDVTFNVAAPVANGVTVSAPASNATVSSPFSLKAQSLSCENQPVAAMAYSIGNGADSAAVSATSLNAQVTASAGLNQVLHVKSWGTSGAGCDTDVTFNVAAPSPSPKPSPSPSSTSTWPVTIPEGALSYPSLQQDSGWSADADSTISPNPPKVYTINPLPLGAPVTMTLDTTGVSGLYTGWMAKKAINTTAGKLHMLVRGSYTFSSVSGIQAWEMGRRLTNSSGVTDNGQTQLVPISGGLLEFDLVPSASGGWKDTGCRFPTFVAGKTYNEELYYVDEANGALSLMYVSLNGDLCKISSSLQSIAGLAQGWAADSAVMAFQPDANPSAVPFNAAITMSAWMW
jgi:hypothetical protein